MGFLNGFLTIDNFPFTTSSGENNDVAIEASGVSVTTTNDGDSITGFSTGLTPAGAASTVIFVANASPTNKLILKHNSSSSAAGNRIFIRNLVDLVIQPLQVQQLRFNGTYYVPGSAPTVIPSGTITRASSASSGTQVVTINSPMNVISFSGINDADATVLSDGWDNGIIAVCTRSNSITVIVSLVSTNTKSHADSIYVVNAAGNGWRANVTAITATTFTLTWTKIGSGLNITVKFAAIL